MADATIGVGDNVAKRAFLCRDPCFPLFVEQTFTNLGGYVVANIFQHDLEQGETIFTGGFPYDSISTVVGAGATVDSTPVTAQALANRNFPLLTPVDAGVALFAPDSMGLDIYVVPNAPGANGSIFAHMMTYNRGEWLNWSAMLTLAGSGWRFATAPGGALVQGAYSSLPIGRTTRPAGPTALVSMECSTAVNTQGLFVANMYFGVTTGGTYSAPSGTGTCLFPFAPPPEFGNSVVPYTNTRLTASAALFTNVSPTLAKEGTILAGRLKANATDPWDFNQDAINAVHPRLRYYGPMEKGLYTFTTPGANDMVMTDGWMTMPNNSTRDPARWPVLRNWDFGIYNAMIFSDFGGATGSTTLATSQYVHLEFESSSSLFVPGTSSMTLETLHAAEVGLLRFGHFHENPLHWAAIAAAAKKALAIVGPMVAPYIQRAGERLVTAGVNYIRGKRAAGNRSMPQAALQTPPAQRPRPKRRPAASKRRPNSRR